ncbi:Hypothetical_protein [Hexamita inflata]|uniref:Hypothetical_protein n=1 Tax=Hexamita inflata TaxID=28002 RepID=A0AA86P5H3_9EUKA|nr:Hypothetical protein HINF_LOCUS19633 [Hexamita inflata]CAI9965581.1 Hypothetical protein HINF_LOCUS53226 [Hexamita inflata]
MQWFVPSDQFYSPREFTHFKRLFTTHDPQKRIIFRICFVNQLKIKATSKLNLRANKLNQIQIKRFQNQLDLILRFIVHQHKASKRVNYLKTTNVNYWSRKNENIRYKQINIKTEHKIKLLFTKNALKHQQNVAQMRAKTILETNQEKFRAKLQKWAEKKQKINEESVCLQQFNKCLFCLLMKFCFIE